MKNYNKLADDFAKKTGTKLIILDSEYKKHFTDDKQPRWVFRCKLVRKGKQYTFDFGQSVAKGGEEPAIYDILACLTKYDVGSISEFCGEFGYDLYIYTNNGRHVRDKKIVNLYNNVC